MPGGNSKWPKDTNNTNFTNCAETDPCKQGAWSGKTTACYPKGESQGDKANSDQFCAFVYNGIVTGAPEGCCTGLDKDKDNENDKGTEQKGCPGACDNVRNPRPPQAYDTGGGGAPIDGDGDGDGDGDDADTPEEKKVKSTLTIALIWIIVLLIISTLAYIL